MWVGAMHVIQLARCFGRFRAASPGDKAQGFAGDASGRWPLVADATRVSLPHVDANTGTLSDTGQSVDATAPRSIAFCPEDP